MYEVGISAEFQAWHVMPGVEGPEGQLHAHDYRLEVVVARPSLDDRAMVCDLDVLEAALHGATEHVRGRDLEEIRPPEAEAVTVEILARWAHRQIARSLPVTEAELSVRVWESPRAFGGYAAPLSSS